MENPLSPLRAVSVAGRQRMLSQRLAKAWLLVGQGVQPGRSSAMLRHSADLFERQLGALAGLPAEGAVAQARQVLEEVWRPYRRRLDQSPSRDAARELLYLSEGVLGAAQDLTVAVERMAGTAQARLVNLAGRERMLSQRMAHLHLFQEWDVSADHCGASLAVARDEFRDSLAELLAAARAPAARTQMERVARCWNLLDTVLSAPSALDRKRRNAAVSAASETLLRQAERAVELFEALPEDLRNVNHASFVDHDWALRYQPSATSRVAAFARGRVTGGSSAVNTAIALRGAPEDYDEWSSLGNRLWSWERVLPYFIRLENDLDHGDKPYHGTTGPIPIRRHTRDELVPYQAAFLDACSELEYPATDDHNDPDWTGAGPHPMNKRGTLRISTAIAYLGPARERPNLTILADTDVVRVTTAEGNATGVEVRSRDGRRQTFTARQVVLACGAIHTPAVLVRSGIGPKETLERLGIELVPEPVIVGF